MGYPNKPLGEPIREFENTVARVAVDTFAPTDRDELVLVHELRAVAMALGELDDFTVRAPDLVMERDLAACICREAADRIQADAATIARMREALEPFAKAAEAYESHDGQHDFPDDFELTLGAFNRPNVGDLRRARAALKGGDHG